MPQEFDVRQPAGDMRKQRQMGRGSARRSGQKGATLHRRRTCMQAWLHTSATRQAAHL